MDRTALVFVHGILSSAKVWSAFTKLIEADPDLSGFEAWPFGYSSPWMEWRLGRRIPDVDVTASSLDTFLAHRLVNYRRIVLVGHSQGGLVVQRYLHRMLTDGRGLDLARVRLVVLFACPNDGSQFLSPLRRALHFLLRHTQDKGLFPLDDRIIDTRRTVLNNVVQNKALSSTTCHIPLFAYAGESDGIVLPQSAKSVFPNVGVLPGDHSSIIQPDTQQHRTFVTLKHHLVHDLIARDGDSPNASSSPGLLPPGQTDHRLRAYGHINRTLHHVDRPAQHQRVTAALTGGGITVLHGLGGIGKSVLAFDACEDPEVSSTFPDVLWATLGQDARVSTELARWLRLLGGGTDTSVPDLEYLKAEVAARLRHRRCLLVVDDAWRLSDVQAFNVGGEHCHLLVTTRDAAIAHQLGVDVLRIPALDTEEAVTLLRRWARGHIDSVDAAQLEPVVRRVAQLPLAVKLAGAQLADTTVADWLTQFRVHKLRAPRVEGVHDSLVATIDLSLAVLGPVARTACEALAVFPEDTPVSSAIVGQYWRHLGLGSATGELLTDLQRLALTQQTRDDCGTVCHALHDLVRDVLRYHLGTERLRQAHRALLDSYQPTERGWPAVPDDGYLHDNLVYHLEGAGDHPAVAALFTNQRWMGARLDSNRHGYDGYLADLDRARTVAQRRGSHEPDLAELNRYALIESSLVTLSGAYSATTVARAAQLGVWTLEFAMSVARRACRAGQPHPLLALLRTRLLSPALVTEAETLLIQAAERPTTEFEIDLILDDLLGIASPKGANDVAAVLLRMATDTSLDPVARRNAILALARHRPWQPDGPALLTCARELLDPAMQPAVIQALARMPGAPVDELGTHFAKPQEPTTIPSTAELLSAEASGPLRDEIVDQVIASISASWATPRDRDTGWRDPAAVLETFEEAAKQFTPAEIARVLEAVRGVPGVLDPARVVGVISPFLAPAQRHAAIEWARELPAQGDRVLTLVALLGAAPTRQILAIDGPIANQLTTHYMTRSNFPMRAFIALDRLQLLFNLLDQSDERAATVEVAADLLIRQEDDMIFHPDDVDPYMVDASIARYSGQFDEWINLFDESQMRQFLCQPRRFEASRWSARSIANLAQHATPAVRDDVVARLAPAVAESHSFELAPPLCRWMKSEMRTTVLDDCLKHWRGLSTHKENSSIQPRSDSLRSLAGLLDHHLLDQIIEAIPDIPDIPDNLGGSPRANAIVNLGVSSLTADQAHRLGELAFDLETVGNRRAALAALAPWLPNDHLKRALALANNPRSASSAKLLASVLARLPEDQRIALDHAVHTHAASTLNRNNYAVGSMLEVLESLSSSCSKRALNDLLRLCRQLNPPHEAVSVLATIASRLTGAQRDSIVRKAYDLASTASQQFSIVDEFGWAMRLLGPLLPADLARSAWARMSKPDPYDDEDGRRLTQLIRLQHHHPELDSDLSMLRRMVGDHLTLLATRELSSLLYFVGDVDWLRPPLIPTKAIDEMIQDVDTICTTWRWR
jgi:hypothetical protein